MALNDRELLAKTLQAEAGNQGIGGMLAVGSVIRNRMAQGGSLSDVILAPAQFSAWNKVTGAVGGEQGQDMVALKPSEDAYAAADAILSGNAPDVTGGATHYYNPSISNPAWGKEKAGGDWTKIGAHIFGKAGDFKTGAAKMNGEQTQKPQGLLGGLLGGGSISGSILGGLGMNEDQADRFRMAILAGTGDPRMAPLIEATQARMQERRGEAKEQRQRNKSIEFLKSRADAGDATAKEILGAVSTGALPIGTGVSTYLTQALAGPQKPFTELAKIEADFAAGRLSPEQYKTAVEAFANKNKMGVRLGPDGTFEFVQGGGLSKLTEAQSKDVNWAARMTGALKAFEPVADVLTSPTDKLFGLDPTGLARYAQSGDYQKAEVAGLEFLAPLLRKDTGAAVTPKEWDFYSKIYIPTVGDQPPALEAKRAARKRALEALKLGIPPEYVTRVQTVGGDPIAEAISEGLIEKDKAQKLEQQPSQQGYTWQNVPAGEVVIDTDGKKYKFIGGDRNQLSNWQEVK